MTMNGLFTAHAIRLRTMGHPGKREVEEGDPCSANQVPRHGGEALPGSATQVFGDVPFGAAHHGPASRPPRAPVQILASPSNFWHARANVGTVVAVLTHQQQVRPSSFCPAPEAVM